MSNVWNIFLDKTGSLKTVTKNHKHNLVPSHRFQDSRHFLQSLEVPKNIINHAQRVTGPNYRDVDNPLVKIWSIRLNG